MKRFLYLVSLGVFMFFMMVGTGFGDTRTWSGSGGDNKWTTAGNWDTVPVANDTIQFAGSTTSNSNNFGANTQFNGITFNAGASSFKLAGNTINLNGPITNSSSNDQEVGINFTMATTTNINSNTAGKTVTLSGNINNGGSTLTVQGDGNTAISGVVSGNGGGLNKGGSGTLTLSNSNTYGSATTINLGTLSINTIKDAGTACAIGTAAGNPTISIGLDTYAGNLTYTGTGDTTNRVIDLAGTTGGVTIDQSGTGNLKFTSAFTASGNGQKP